MQEAEPGPFEEMLQISHGAVNKARVGKATLYWQKYCDTCLYTHKV